MSVDCFVKLCISICYTAHLMCIPLHCVCLGPSQIHYSFVVWNGNAYSQSDIDHLCTQTCEYSLTVSL